MKNRGLFKFPALCKLKIADRLREIALSGKKKSADGYLCQLCLTGTQQAQINHSISITMLIYSENNNLA